MGKIVTGPMRGTSGKIDDLQLVYKTMKNGTTYASRLPPKPAEPVRYERQMDHRLQVASVTNCYQPFRGRLCFPHDPASEGRRMFNDFMKHNVQALQGCYLTKEQREAGFQVLGNFIVSTGPETMPSVEVIEQEDRFVTNLDLGELEISPLTTQAEFAAALLRANRPRLRESNTVHDSLTLLLARQLIAAGTAKPTILVHSFQIPLLTQGDANRRRLSELVDVSRLLATPVVQPEGGVRRCLSLSKGEGILLFTVIHSRRKGSGPVQCSTQALCGANPLREVFLTPEARAKAFISYGGVNRRNPFDPYNATPTRFEDPTPADITALSNWTPPDYQGPLPDPQP